MPWLLVRLLLVLVCLLTGSAHAKEPQAIPALVLDENQPGFMVGGDILAWMDEGSHATIDGVAGDPSLFARTAAHTHFALNKFDTLWIKLRLMPSAASAPGWRLNIPLPYLDSVTLYQQNGDGRWSIYKAGDSLAQSEWQSAGLYPEFEMNLRSGTTTDVYLQVRNFQPVSLPLRLSSTIERQHQRLLEILSLGLMLGALLSLVVLSLLRFLEHRNTIDGLAALFGLCVTVTVAQINGVMNLFVWHSLPAIGNLASSMLPVIAVGCTLLFLRQVFSLSVNFYWYDRLMSTIGWGTLVTVVTYGFTDRFVAERISSAFMLTAYATCLGATVLSWRSGSSSGRWLTLALLPQFATLIYMLVESLDWVPAFWPIRYIMSLGVAMTLPVLLYLLSHITHDRKELVVRANHLPTQDALTGLLTGEVFQQHLEESVQRAIEHREPLALVVVRLANHDHIRQTFGDTTAEQCLLRAVVKVQRILRDVDPAGRVSTAEFGLLMEGVKTRESLTERMVQLIGSGLIPVPGLVPEVTLHFQAACVLLHEIPVPPDIVLSELHKILADMSPRTRRPIRFLEAVPTQVSELAQVEPVVPGLPARP